MSGPCPDPVDGNQLCGLGHTTQTMVFYRSLTTIAQAKQSLNIGDLTDSVNAYCQAISGSTSIDFRALIGDYSILTGFWYGSRLAFVV